MMDRHQPIGSSAGTRPRKGATVGTAAAQSTALAITCRISGR